MSEKISKLDPLADVAGIVDTKYEEDGDWFEHAPDDSAKIGKNQIDGFRHMLIDDGGNGLRSIKVSSSHTAAYSRAQKDISVRSLRMGARKRAEFEEQSRAELLADHCVKDWDFTDRKGNPIPMDRELVVRVLREPQFRNHRNFIMVAIATLQGDIQQASEEDQGN